jgi:hypothetical protein
MDLVQTSPLGKNHRLRRSFEKLSIRFRHTLGMPFRPAMSVETRPGLG